MKFHNLCLRILSAFLISVCVSLGALAQYGGGGTPVGSSSSGSGYSSGSKAKVIGIVAGAAAAGGVIFWLMHRQATVNGCTQAVDGGLAIHTIHHHTYILDTHKLTADIPAGSRVTLQGKKTKSKSGKREFEVMKIKHDYGACH